jgi:peptidoglycan/LPS O-acetylase OafA/YrhL
MPGLDGLRALAVIAVLLYHADLAWIPGGFLGVEVFFVLSGYLITALLLAEWRQHGRIDLKGFWFRRARRLLPALYLLLVVTLAYAVLFLPDEVARLRGDVAAAIGYVTNWYLILGHQSYFEEMGRPSLLKHLWSLAVEEQFYLLWPPVLTVAISLGAARWRERRGLFIALAGAATSAALMAILYQPDVDPSRIYYGTDTRATGLLIGSALAFLWAPGRAGETPAPPTTRAHRLLHIRRRGQLRRRWGWTVPLLLDVVGLAALGGLVLFCLRLGEFDPFLYQGGLASVGLVTAAVIAVVAHPSTRLGSVVLGWGPLRWLGVRSYGIYLWHWPVFMVTRPQLDVPLTGLPLLGLRLAATVLLAHLSYRYVEKPIRQGALGRAWSSAKESWTEAQGLRRWQLGATWAGMVVPVLALCAALGVSVAYAKAPAPPSYLTTKAIHTTSAQTTPKADTAGAGASESTAAEKTASTAERGQQAQARESAATKPEKPTRPAATKPVATGPVTAVGDSVMLGAATHLQRTIPNLTTMDAQVGLQVASAIDILRARRAAGQLGDVVLVHVGNNGTFTTEQFDEMMSVLAGVREVVFVNVNVPRPWERPNNAVLAAGVQRYPNAVLVDWYSASVNHPEYFVEDGVHLQIKGQRVYSRLIAERLESSLAEGQSQGQ